MEGQYYSRLTIPRSARTQAMLVALLSGRKLLARELAEVSGLRSKSVYPTLKRYMPHLIASEYLRGSRARRVYYIKPEAVWAVREALRLSRPSPEAMALTLRLLVKQRMFQHHVLVS